MIKRPIIRAGWLAALAALVLSACGGGGSAAVKPPASIPAGFILTAKQARALPTVSITPTAEATTVPGVVAQPTTRPVRTQGPPGNPEAHSFTDPPAPGRYPHRISIDGDFGHQELLVEVEVQGATQIQGGRRQVQLWDIEDFPQEFTYVWTPDRLLLEHVDTTNVDGSKNECDLKPPSIQAKLPMEIGETWDLDYTCDDARTKGSSEIIRTERVEVGDAQVDTFVISTQTKTTTKQGTFRDKTTTWYAPKERLFVIIETKTTGEFGSVEVALDCLSVTPSAN